MWHKITSPGNYSVCNGMDELSGVSNNLCPVLVECWVSLQEKGLGIQQRFVGVENKLLSGDEFGFRKLIIVELDEIY